jgi:uncharacterized protein HemX
MDKTTENLPEEVETSSQANDMTDNVNPTEQQVIINKSGAAVLSLMVSILALLVSAYLFYQTQINQNNSSNQNEITELNQQLYQANQALSTDLASSQVKIKENQQLLQSLATQISNLQLPNDHTTPTFDNSENLALIEQLHEQLDQQKIMLQKLSTEQGSNQTINPVIDQESIQRQATLNQLRMVQLMLNNNQIPQAILSLEKHLTMDQLKPTIQVKLKQLLLDLNNIKQVDKKSLFNELDQAQNRVVALTLETEKIEVTESSWYEKFISVKKIKSDNSLANSTDLAILKADLAQHLIQAKIALSLADQESWQLQLTAAVQKLKTQLPNQDELRQQVLNLSQQTVVPDLPEGINFQAIINELTRLN